MVKMIHALLIRSTSITAQVNVQFNLASSRRAKSTASRSPAQLTPGKTLLVNHRNRDKRIFPDKSIQRSTNMNHGRV